MFPNTNRFDTFFPIEKTLSDNFSLFSFFNFMLVPLYNRFITSQKTNFSFIVIFSIWFLVVVVYMNIYYIIYFFNIKKGSLFRYFSIENYWCWREMKKKERKKKITSVPTSNTNNVWKCFQVLPNNILFLIVIIDYCLYFFMFFVSIFFSFFFCVSFVVRCYCCFLCFLTREE